LKITFVWAEGGPDPRKYQQKTSGEWHLKSDEKTQGGAFP